MPGQTHLNPHSVHLHNHVFGSMGRSHLSNVHQFDSSARQGTPTPEPGAGANHYHYQHHQHHQHHHAINNTQVIDYDGLNAAVAEASLLEAGFSKPSFLDRGDSPDGPFPLARSATGSAVRMSSSNEFRRRSARKASYYSERSPRPPIPEQLRYTFFSQSTGVIQAPTMAKILTNAMISNEEGMQEVTVFSDLLKDGCYWLDILDPDDFDMQVLAKYFNIHPLTIEDISTEEVREKYEVFRHYYFVCFRTFDQDYNSGSYLQPASMYSLVLKDGIITFHFRPTSHHLSVLLRIEQMQSHITLTPDWINYALMDDITDCFASPIQTIEYEVDSIDELVLLLRENESNDMLRRIGSCRKNVMAMSRLLTNKADVVRGLMKRFDDRYGVPQLISNHQDYFGKQQQQRQQQQQQQQQQKQQQQQQQTQQQIQQSVPVSPEQSAQQSPLSSSVASPQVPNSEKLAQPSTMTEKSAYSMEHVPAPVSPSSSQQPVQQPYQAEQQPVRTHQQHLQQHQLLQQQYPPHQQPNPGQSHHHREGEMLLYLGDILDHVLTMLQSLGSYEKILDRSHSNYLAQISLEINQLSNRTNHIMGKLTFFASLIVPMTLISGLWGMNITVPGQPVGDAPTSLDWFFGLLGFMALYCVLALIVGRNIARASAGRRMAARSIPGGLHALHRNSFRSFTAAAHAPASPSEVAPERYDVVIVGGGIAGSALACALASSKIASTQKIALIEASDMSHHIDKWHPVPHEYSNRVSSLAPRSVQFLKRIGVWDELDPSRIGACEAMQVWDGVSGSRIVFDAADSTNALHPKVTSFLQEHVFGGASPSSPSSSQDDTAAKADQPTNSTQDSRPVLAWMTENLHVQYGLRKQMLAHQERGVALDVFDRTKVLDIHTMHYTEPASTTTATGAKTAATDLSDWPVIQLDNGKAIQARLLIGADGVNSPVRSFAKIESLGWDYGQFGLVATLKIDPSTCSMRRQGEGIAWQRFLPTGPIALLPLNDGLASLVWSTTPKLAQELKKLPPQAFCALVNAGFSATPAELNYLYRNIGADGQPLVDFEKEIEWRSSVAEKEALADPKRAAETPRPPKVVDVQANTRAPFPLRFRNSNSYVEDRVALVGDAAHTVHPLAGQGLNQGLADVECLARVIEQSLRSGSDIGNIHSLTPYSSERFLPNLAMLGTVDKLQKLYSTDFAPVVWARSWGLSAVDQLGPLKTELMRFAMGVEEASGRP
ncbi:putative ubiquinone biosynthesis monooxygenase [Actinomortierella ambigua]|nr:putative ubiquinone biosynthesis monooxygenase [Actinomortierella ambigua]